MLAAMDEPTASEIGEIGLGLWRYWRGLPREGCVPYRRDFDPMAIPRLLPWVSITERPGPGQWRMRLIGTGIRQRAGREQTGGNFLDLVEPERRDLEDRRLALVLTHPCGSTTVRRARRASGLVRLDRTLALPLRDNQGEVRLLVATTEYLESADATPDGQQSGIHVLERRYLDLGAGVPAMPEA